LKRENLFPLPGIGSRRLDPPAGSQVIPTETHWLFLFICLLIYLGGTR
jgi:hypothetical protein